MHLARAARSIALLAALVAALVAATGGAWWGALSFAVVAIGAVMIAAWATARTARKPASPKRQTHD